MKTYRGRDVFRGAVIDVDVNDDGRIAALRDVPGEHGEVPWIGPGLVDLQVNGHADGDANAHDPHPSHIAAMSRSLAARGVTRFLPTVITASQTAMEARIRAIAEATRDDLTGRMVAGIHVEGPSLSPQAGPRGVHPLEHIRPPRITELEGWLAASGGLLRVVTLSPHHDGAVEATRFLCAHGVRVSIGHTHADDAQIRAVVDAGATLSTHLGNGAHAELPRHPNYIWSQLAEERLAAGIIADGHHLPDSVLSTIVSAKGESGSFLVSDAVATPPALREDGRSTVGGHVALAPDGALRHRETGFLAGSVQALDVGVATIARLRRSLGAAFRLAASTPARLLDGSDPWCPGARADILRFTWDQGDMAITPETVLVAGRPPLAYPSASF